jgi:hypothetical protein
MSHRAAARALHKGPDHAEKRTLFDLLDSGNHDSGGAEKSNNRGTFLGRRREVVQCVAYLVKPKMLMKTTQLSRIFTASISFLFSGLCAVLAFTSTQHASLSLEDRVAYQKGIEEVYWRHRAATQLMNHPQPLGAVMPDAVIREKVDDTLRKSAALETYWQRPITAEQLQTEISRMAAHTRQPDLLRELWKALDNDPYVIAECLARPLLVERELSAWYARDARFHGELKARIEAELQSKSGGAIDSLSGALWERQILKGGDGSSKSQFDAASHNEHAAILSDTDWQRVVTQIGGLFGNDDFPVGQVSGLQENETEFYVVALRERTAERLTLASMRWPKQSVDAWWQNVRNNFAASVQDISMQSY